MKASSVEAIPSVSYETRRGDTKVKMIGNRQEKVKRIFFPLTPRDGILLLKIGQVLFIIFVLICLLCRFLSIPQSCFSTGKHGGWHNTHNLTPRGGDTGFAARQTDRQLRQPEAGYPSTEAASPVAYPQSQAASAFAALAFLDDAWLDKLLDKIQFVESGNRLNPPDGDGGQAAGPLQIHKEVVDDVNLFYGTEYTDADRYDLQKSREIARLYISWWLKINRAEIATRIWNGGPNGWRKESTKKYWQKVRGK